jgi:hypothetical protein
METLKMGMKKIIVFTIILFCVSVSADAYQLSENDKTKIRSFCTKRENALHERFGLDKQDINGSIESCVSLQSEAAEKVIPYLNKFDGMSVRGRLEWMEKNPSESMAIICIEQNDNIFYGGLDYFGFQECMK